MATGMEKVRKLEYGLKLSIRGKIVGLLLQDLDSMVKTVMAIEREVDNSRSIRDAGASNKRGESQLSSSRSRKKQRTSTPRGFQGQGRDYQGQASHPKIEDTSGLLASQGRGHVSISTNLDT